MTFTECHIEIYFLGVEANMSKESLYWQGYMAGYRDGVQDAQSGKITDWKELDIAKVPVNAMAISQRARNCLIYSGCTQVGDVIALTTDRILRMRNLGPKTAAEIAQWLIENGIFYSAWSEHIYREK